MKVFVFDLNGNEKGAEELEIDEKIVREDLILRAFLAEQSQTFQPKGNFKYAGLLTTARYVGRKEAYHTIKNRGISRLPRQMFPKGRIGYVRIVPHAVKGRRAHPPKPEKKIVEKINKKEWKKALKCALLGTQTEYAKKRNKISISPILIEGLENVKKLKEMKKILDKFFSEDFERVKERGKRRLKRKKGKKYPKSILIITGSKEEIKCNLPGVDVAKAKEIKVMDLAPGGVPGRACVFTKSGLEEMREVIK
ncbi:MAG: 50S ribosomal protein L4 [Candidatus Micrarchaeia archaeon]